MLFADSFVGVHCLIKKKFALHSCVCRQLRNGGVRELRGKKERLTEMSLTSDRLGEENGQFYLRRSVEARSTDDNLTKINLLLHNQRWSIRRSNEVWSSLSFSFSLVLVHPFAHDDSSEDMSSTQSNYWHSLLSLRQQTSLMICLNKRKESNRLQSAAHLSARKWRTTGISLLVKTKINVLADDCCFSSDCIIPTYQFEFHIVVHHSLRSRSSTPDCFGLYGKCPDYIGNCRTDRPQLDEKRETNLLSLIFSKRRNKGDTAEPWLKLTFLHLRSFAVIPFCVHRYLDAQRKR